MGVPECHGSYRKRGCPTEMRVPVFWWVLVCLGGPNVSGVLVDRGSLCVGGLSVPGAPIKMGVLVCVQSW